MRGRCEKCGQSYFSCLCAPAQLKKAGCVGLIKLSPYREEGDAWVARRMILGMKRRPRSAAFSFVAKELSHSVREWLSAREQEELPTVITHLPRAPRRVRQYGFDQAEQLARLLSLELGIPHRTLLRRVRDGREQKKLHAGERQENMKGAFRAVGDCTGCRVLLVDDLVTTGAGMAEATRVLREADATELCGVVMAATPRAAKRARRGKTP